MASRPEKRQKRAATRRPKNVTEDPTPLSKRDTFDKYHQKGCTKHVECLEKPPSTIAGSKIGASDGGPELDGKLTQGDSIAGNLASKPAASGLQALDGQKPISNFFQPIVVTQGNGKHQEYQSWIHGHGDLQSDRREPQPLDAIEDDVLTADGHDGVMEGERGPEIDHGWSNSATNSERSSKVVHRFKLGHEVEAIASHPEESADGHHNSDLWTERFRPSGISELTIHQRKVSELREWLEHHIRYRLTNRLLVLKGPPGSGKRTVLETLSRSMGIQVFAWKAPRDTSFFFDSYDSYASQFKEFLCRSGHFSHLELTDQLERASSPTSETSGSVPFSRARITLCEDFSTGLLSSPSAMHAFRTAVLEYLSSGLDVSPSNALKTISGPRTCDILVLILTESALRASDEDHANLSLQRLLGQEILQHEFVSVIEFNRVASSFLLKTLNLTLQKVRRRGGRCESPPKDVLKWLCDSGDMRSSINNLQMLCTANCRAMKDTSQKILLQPVISERSDGPNYGLASLKASTLDLFHAVGKVVYNKRDNFYDYHPADPGYSQSLRQSMPPRREHSSKISIDQLSENTGVDTRTFVAALHENFVLSCSGTNFLESLDNCLCAVSECDILDSFQWKDYTLKSASWKLEGVKHEELILQLAVRSLLCSLPSSVNRKGNNTAHQSMLCSNPFKMQFPASVRLQKEVVEVKSLVKRSLSSPQYTASGSDGSLAISASRQALRSRRPEGHEPQNSLVEKSTQGSQLLTMPELILERLPYIHNILSCTYNTAGSHLQRITQFGMFDQNKAALSEGSDVEHSLHDEATKKNINVAGRSIFDGSSNSADLKEGPANVGPSTYLREDDIEDD